MKDKSVFNTFHLGILPFPLLLDMLQASAWEATLETFKKEGNYKRKRNIRCPVGKSTPQRGKLALKSLIIISVKEFGISNSAKFNIWYVLVFTKQVVSEVPGKQKEACVTPSLGYGCIIYRSIQVIQNSTM